MLAYIPYMDPMGLDMLFGFYDTDIVISVLPLSLGIQKEGFF